MTGQVRMRRQLSERLPDDSDAPRDWLLAGLVTVIASGLWGLELIDGPVGIAATIAFVVFVTQEDTLP